MFRPSPLLALLSLLTILTTTTVSAYASPGSCSGFCNSHDPSVCQRTSDGRYFRFDTNNEITISSSSSLNGPWTWHGKALPSGSKINLAGNKDLWAPDVHKVGNLYYMYYAVSTFGSQNSAIGLATSPSMDVGTWTDLGSVGIQTAQGKNNYNAIDPNLVNYNGAWYITFGSFWADLFQVKMNSAATWTAGSPYPIAFQPSGAHAEEGATVFWANGYWYLLYSAGVCCGYQNSKPAAGQEYKIMMCRSNVPTGGFVDKTGKACSNGGGSVLLASHDYVYGPGGQGVFYDSKGAGYVLYYHYANTKIGIADSQYQFGWNTLQFSGGWPYV